MKKKKIIGNKYGSMYPVIIYILVVFITGLIFYLLNDTVSTFIGYTDGVLATFFSVFWKGIIVLMPLLAGVWMIIYMQRLRRYEYE